MTAEDINTGWGAILETFEMSLFAFLHVKAFSYRPYRPQDPDAKNTSRIRSLLHAFDFRETYREMRDGVQYGWHRARGREVDVQAHRIGHLSNAFDRSRLDVWNEKEKGGSNESPAKQNRSKGLPTGLWPERSIEVGVDRMVEIEGERQWLGVGNDHDYGISRRNPSDALGIQIERELARRGYNQHVYIQETHDQPLHDSRVQRSWWRGIYDRLSTSHQDEAVDGLTAAPGKRRSRQHRSSRRQSRQGEETKQLMEVYEYDDQPPPSIIQTYRRGRQAKKAETDAYPRHFSPASVVAELPTRFSSPPPVQQVPRIITSPPPGQNYPMTQLASIPPLQEQPRLLSPPPQPGLLGLMFRTSAPTSSAGHTSRTSLVPPSSDQSHGRPPPMMRQVSAGRTVEVTLPTPLGGTSGRSPEGPSPDRSPMSQPAITSLLPSPISTTSPVTRALSPPSPTTYRPARNSLNNAPNTREAGFAAPPPLPSKTIPMIIPTPVKPVQSARQAPEPASSLPAASNERRRSSHRRESAHRVDQASPRVSMLMPIPSSQHLPSSSSPPRRAPAVRRQSRDMPSAQVPVPNYSPHTPPYPPGSPNRAYRQSLSPEPSPPGGWTHPELAGSHRPIYAAAMVPPIAPTASYAPEGRMSVLTDSPYPVARRQSGQGSPTSPLTSRTSLQMQGSPGHRGLELSPEGYAIGGEANVPERKGWFW
jgi:hypothetical protein